MNASVDFTCPHCGVTTADVDWPGDRPLHCETCGSAPLGDSEGLGSVPERCPVCGNDELYVQRDFNRKIGVAFVVLAVLLALPTRGISLAVLVIIDLALHRLLPAITICYRCRAIIRGAERHPAHEGFDMAIEDKYRAIRGTVVGEGGEPLP